MANPWEKDAVVSPPWEKDDPIANTTPATPTISDKTDTPNLDSVANVGSGAWQAVKDGLAGIGQSFQHPLTTLSHIGKSIYTPDAGVMQKANDAHAQGRSGEAVLRNFTAYMPFAKELDDLNFGTPEEQDKALGSLMVKAITLRTAPDDPVKTASIVRAAPAAVVQGAKAGGGDLMKGAAKVAGSAAAGEAFGHPGAGAALGLAGGSHDIVSGISKGGKATIQTFRDALKRDRLANVPESELVSTGPLTNPGSRLVEPPQPPVVPGTATGPTAPPAPSVSVSGPIPSGTQAIAKPVAPAEPPAPSRYTKEDFETLNRTKKATRMAQVLHAEGKGISYEDARGLTNDDWNMLADHMSIPRPGASSGNPALTQAETLVRLKQMEDARQATAKPQSSPGLPPIPQRPQ